MAIRGHQRQSHLELVTQLHVEHCVKLPMRAPETARRVPHAHSGALTLGVRGGRSLCRDGATYLMREAIRADEGGHQS